MSTTRGSYFKGDKLEQMVYKLLADSYIFVNLEHDRKMAEISNYTMVPTPGLVAKSFGILPPQRLEFQ